MKMTQAGPQLDSAEEHEQRAGEAVTSSAAEVLP